MWLVRPQAEGSSMGLRPHSVYTLLLLTQLERVLTSDERSPSCLTLSSRATRLHGQLACQSNESKHPGPIVTLLFLHLGFLNPQFLTTDPSLGSTLDVSFCPWCP